MNPYINLKDPLKCSKCNLCMVRCRQTHGESRILSVDSIPHICIQCEDVPCQKACRVGAIYLKEGIAIVDEEKCVACKMCLDACPHQGMYIKDLMVYKCTLCLDSDLLIPACIEACPNKILEVKCRKEEDE